MNIRIIALLLFTGIVFCNADQSASHPEKKKVFICNSEGAKKYHLKENCEGLDGCKNEIISVTKDEAIKKGKTELCGFED